MAIKERDVLLQGQENGEQTMDFPITRLANVEGDADVKSVPGDNDYIPIVDSADGGQMKKTPASVFLWTPALNDIIPKNAGARNAIYRGKYLGTSVTAAQYAAIAAGTFDDLFIGDYWTIGGVNYRIAAFDYYYNTGDTKCTTHHAVIVPDTKLYNHVMNDTNTTEGGYANSKMRTEGLAQANNTITSAFGAEHILTHRSLLTNAVTDGYASAGSWYDSTVELMTEQNVYGGKVFGNTSCGTALPYNYTVDKSQFPLFAHRPDMIDKLAWFWLRDVVSAADFAAVGHRGVASYTNASNADGVRPAFSIKS